MYNETTIICNSVDELVRKGILNIKDNGRRIKAHSGDAMQCSNVTYVLTDCYNRVHTLRADKAITYFAKELLAYFQGSLNIYSNGKGYGLAHASSVWKGLCDKDNCINSNYGYYVFHQKTEDGKTQLQWVREQFKKNLDTRKALININGLQHKKDTKDFPCTIGMQFTIEEKTLNCDVISRSTDIITGLPYDIGFFSVVTELLASLLSSDLNMQIEPGYVAVHACYTQIYDKTSGYVKQILGSNEIKELQTMPKIENGIEVLDEIYNINERDKVKSKFMIWCLSKT